MKRLGVAVLLVLMSAGAVWGQMPATCRVRSADRDGAYSMGTGALVAHGDTNGVSLIFTAAHVVRDSRPGGVTVSFPFADGKPSNVAVKIGHFDDRADIAILWAPWARIRHIPAAPVLQQYTVGETYYLEGFAHGPFRRLPVRLTRTDLRYSGGVTVLELNQPSRQGDSGGPVYSKDGCLVAIISSSGPRYTIAPPAGPVLRVLSAAWRAVATRRAIRQAPSVTVVHAGHT